MATPKDKTICIFQDCELKSSRGVTTCKEHSAFFKRVREELEDNPKLIYNQRSDNPNRTLTDKETGKRKKPRGKNLPVCCVPSCFELRVPPDPYCMDHYDFAGGD